MFTRATDAGDPSGMMMLGYVHEMGIGGVVKDLRKAVDLYQRSAAFRHPTGMMLLARMYEMGKGGLRRDTHKANSLYTEAQQAITVAAPWPLSVKIGQ